MRSSVCINFHFFFLPDTDRVAIFPKKNPDFVSKDYQLHRQWMKGIMTNFTVLYLGRGAYENLQAFYVPLYKAHVTSQLFSLYHLHLREKLWSFSFTKLRDFLVGSAHVRSLLFPLPGRTVHGRKRALLCKEKTWFPHGSNSCCCFLPSQSIIQHQ